MSQSKIKHIKNIEVGKFYYIHDGSKSGHPGFIVWKNDEKNRYLVIRTDSDKPGDIPKKDRGVKHITELKHRTSKNVAKSYLRNRPMICRRKDIGKIMSDLAIYNDDMEIVKNISKRKPELSPSFRRGK